jgi:hypothetical protein
LIPFWFDIRLTNQHFGFFSPRFHSIKQKQPFRLQERRQFDSGVIAKKEKVKRSSFISQDEKFIAGNHAAES